MSYLEFLKFCQENHLNIFTFKDLKILLKSESENYLRLKINRWQKKNYIKSLKKGLYVLKGTALDEFEIASKLVIPSYISLESALSHYSLIPDVSAVVSSITTKQTKSFSIGQTKYQYQHIKTSLFTDFHNLKDDIFIASMEKAILDFFYFRKLELSDQFFERLNSVTLQKLNIKKLEKLAEIYPKTIRKPLNYLKNAISR